MLEGTHLLRSKEGVGKSETVSSPYHPPDSTFLLLLLSQRRASAVARHLTGSAKFAGRRAVLSSVFLLKVTLTIHFFFWLSFMLLSDHFFLCEWKTLLCLQVQTLRASGSCAWPCKGALHKWWRSGVIQWKEEKSRSPQTGIMPSYCSCSLHPLAVLWLAGRDPGPDEVLCTC